MTTTTMPQSKATAIPLKPCASKQVSSYGYDASTGTLAMRFRQGNVLSGVYHYSVTPEQFDALEKAESKGKHFAAKIKSLDCCKIVPDKEFQKWPL